MFLRDYFYTLVEGSSIKVVGGLSLWGPVVIHYPFLTGFKSAGLTQVGLLTKVYIGIRLAFISFPEQRLGHLDSIRIMLICHPGV